MEYQFLPARTAATNFSFRFEKVFTRSRDSFAESFVRGGVAILAVSVRFLLIVLNFITAPDDDFADPGYWDTQE